MLLLVRGDVGVVAERGGVGVVLALDHFHADALRPDAELLDGGGAEGIGGGEHDAVAAFLEEVGELGGGGGLAGAVDADDEDDFRLGREGAQRGGIEREDFRDLLAGDLDDVVGGELLVAGAQGL